MEDYNYFPFYFAFVEYSEDDITRKDSYYINSKAAKGSNESEWQQEYNLIYNSYILEYPGV